MKKLILASAMFTLFVACAKQPDQIAATDLGNDLYSKYSCRNLQKEKLTREQELANLSAKQKSAATGDTIGVILIGIPTSSLTGHDREAQISVTKGRLQAIERQQAAKRCK